MSMILFYVILIALIMLKYAIAHFKNVAQHGS